MTIPCELTPEMMTVAEALDELGATPDVLSEQEKLSLDHDGFVVIPNVLPPSLAALMADRLDEIATEEGERAGLDFHTEAGVTRLGSLLAKDQIFDICSLHPKALAAVRHVMGDDFGLSSNTGRAARPGEGHQGLHRDGGATCANALWVVSEFTALNGPTRLVPGSHLKTTSPHEEMDPLATHPDEVTLLAPAGTLVVINGYTWHGGTRNNSNANRHLISAFFTRRGHYQLIATRRLNPEVRARFSEAELCILDPSAD